MSLPPPPKVEPIRLTQWSHGAGCGCKIAPAVLETILKSDLGKLNDPRLLVGYDSQDDAAVYDLGNGRALISTTDFFSPIVDDAYDFGRIAATNALSDVYAMGGRPMLAVAILGWPVEKLPPELAAKVVEGGRAVCHEAGIALAGGHSIDAPEPFFGLAVTGDVAVSQLKRNSSSKAGDVLLLTKPLGVGIKTTALKRGILPESQYRSVVDLMCRSNAVGEALGAITGIHAMTDVTGFGLAGHLLELCRGSGVQAKIDFSRIPLIDGILDLLAANCYADGALRNWKSYGHAIEGAMTMERMMVLSDPQTSGGLLISASTRSVAEISDLFKRCSIDVNVIGNTTNIINSKTITVI